METISKFASKILVFSDELDVGLDLFGAGPGSFKRYSILPFGFVSRDELIGKWVALDEDSDGDSDDAATRQVVEISRTVENIVGSNFVPAFPVYILSVLQASEASTPIDTGASTHGYFYELFIKASLVRGRTKGDYDIAISFLSFFAYRMFGLNARTFSSEKFVELVREFEELYAIRRDANALLRSLIDAGIFSEGDGEKRFRYRYIYYYFIAKWLAEHVSMEAVRGDVKRLSERLHLENCAGILLFLVHLSKDKYIVDQLLEVAGRAIEQLPQAEFGEDVAFLKRLGGAVEAVVYEEKSIGAARREVLEVLDQHRPIEERPSWEDERDIEKEGSVVDPLVKLNIALKSLQIIGQVVKNSPGSLEAKVKAELMRTCYKLGLGSLGLVLELLGENDNAIMQDLISLIRRKWPLASPHEVSERARATVIGLARATSFGVFSRISMFVGSPDLGPTYAEMVRTNRSVPYRLIDLGISLDHFGDFPEQKVKEIVRDIEKHSLAFWAVQDMALHYFHVFPVRYRTKQRICALLDIVYRSVQSADQTRRLLGPRTGD